MGEMADLAVEEALQMEERRSLWNSGQMSLEDAYEEGIVDELGINIEEVRRL